MKNIIVAEDDHLIRELITKQFQTLKLFDDYKIFEFDNGKDAFEKVKEVTVELLVTDLKMPEMEGNELIGNIVQSGTTMPRNIIVVSGYLPPEHKVNLDNVYFLSKPFSLEEFSGIVLKCLGDDS
ncbi:MAG: response regulator [Oligoflexia bacterium]|nr:response regulator [Oligoflexia bacterium]